MLLADKLKRRSKSHNYLFENRFLSNPLIIPILVLVTLNTLSNLMTLMTLILINTKHFKKYRQNRAVLILI